MYLYSELPFGAAISCYYHYLHHSQPKPQRWRYCICSNLLLSLLYYILVYFSFQWSSSYWGGGGGQKGPTASTHRVYCCPLTICTKPISHLDICPENTYIKNFFYYFHLLQPGNKTEQSGVLECSLVSSEY